MKVLLWKLMIIVPIGAIICYWIVSYLPGLRQMEAEQRVQRAISAAVPAAAPGKLSAAAVLVIDPKPAIPFKTVAAVPATAASIGQQLAGAKQYKPLFDRLSFPAEGESPEGWYAKYVILRSCASVTDRQRGGPRPATPEERRQRFLSGLSEIDTQRPLRIAAFEQLDENRCVGLEQITTTESELSQLLAAAANAGDAKAKALRVERDMWSAYRASGGGANGAREDGPGLPALTDAQIESLKTVLLSKDPEAMIIAGRVLANSIDNLTLQMGPDWQYIDQNAFYNAWQLLGCDFGMDCGGSHARVLSSCAYQGYCGASSLSDNLYFYGNSPFQSQLLERYRAVLRQAVETGDWSQLRFTRGGNPVGTRYFVREAQ
jgi:hypothetical protein